MSGELLDGRYELVSIVGKGATGEVWHGFDALLERPVAIKIVQLEGARDPAMAARFRREGVAIAGLSHPGIVHIFDTGTDAARGWLVMELLNGPNINTLVNKAGPVSFEVGVPLLARVAEGLQAAHDAGITHRDVKPANIVLDAPTDAEGTQPDLLAHPEQGRPVLVDFGIARLVDESGTQLTRPATAIGTAAYMSPEQARGQHVDPASDIYSLACVAYYLLLGRPPFVADSSIAVAHAQAFDDPVPLSELSPDTPPALDALITRMLSKDPALRPTAREVSRELRAIAVNPQVDATLALPAPVDGLPAPVDEPSPQPQAVDGTVAIDRTAAIDGTAAVDGTAPVNGTATIDGTAAVESPPARPSKRAGRVLIALLIVGLVSALIYSWVSANDPEPVPTITMTDTITQTASASTSATPTRQPTVSQQAPTVTEPVITDVAPTTDQTQPITIEPTVITTDVQPTQTTQDSQETQDFQPPQDTEPATPISSTVQPPVMNPADAGQPDVGQPDLG